MSKFQDQIAGLSPAELALLQEKLKQMAAAAPKEAGITRDERRDSAPLSFAQQRMWFINQLEASSAAYNLLTAYRLRGPLDRKALEDSLTEIVRRHETLRTTFSDRDGQPVQIISPPYAVALPLEDLSAEPEAEREQLVQELAAREGRVPFDLTAGPPLRARLLRLLPSDHALILTIHHAATDAWSMSVLARELSALYHAFSLGRPSPLPDLPIQYADYAAWQRGRLRGEYLESQLSYWRGRLGGAPRLEIPGDRARPASRTDRGGTYRFELGAEATAGLRAAGRAEGVTLFITLLAALNALLHRYSGQDDILVGTAIANRTRPEVEGLIGFFANTLVLRTDLSGGPTFRELMKRVKETSLAAHAHQDVPFEKLVEELHVERDMSRTPLFQVMFVMHNTPARPRKLSALEIEQFPVSNGTAKFDLTLVAMEKGGALSCRFEYNSDLFEAATVERMAGHFRTLLAGAAADPGARLSSLPLLSPEEERRVLVEWNRTRTDYPRDRCIHELFEEQAERTPDSPAVLFRDEQLTYRQLDERAERLARHIRAAGVRPGSLVGLCVERSFEMVVGLLGILKAGCAYVPLDPSYPEQRLDFMLADTGAPLLLTQLKFKDGLKGRGARVVCMDEEWEADAGEPVGRPGPAAEPRSLAYVMYTSGSTGAPKGVCVPHRAVVRLVRRTNFADFGSDQIFLQFAPVSFDASTLEIWGPLLNGGRLALTPPGMTSLEELGRAIRDYGVTTLWLTAGLFHMMVDHRLGDLRPLRQLLAGGDVLSVPHVRRFASEARGVTLINGYGPTENTTFTCCHRVGDAAALGPSVPVGRPVANTRVYLLDAHFRPAPVGGVGDLYAGGDGLAQEYLNHPALTAEKFIPDPFSAEPGARMYATGDLARYRADGVVEFVGRADSQLKVRGFRVEPAEIEAALVQHPAVREAAVLAAAEAGGGKRIVAYVVGALSPREAAGELRGHLRQRLPSYMLPSAFVVMEALPLNANGKVDRAALPAPEGDGEDAREGYVAARGDIEEMLAGVWSEVLGREAVGVFDNFFDLGGHSLLATRVVLRVREVFGVELGLRSIFESPTVASFSQRIAEALAGGDAVPAQADGIVPVSRDGALPLSFAQQRLWFVQQLMPDSPLYNVPTAYRVSGPLDAGALGQSIDALVSRHEVLRTSFRVVDGEVVQHVDDAAVCPLEVVDLQALPDGEREAAMWRAVEAEVRVPFDLTAGPPLRARLLRLSPSDHALILTIHHAATDAWSMSVLARELSTLYDAFSLGRPSPLPDLPIQYADYAAWQRERLRGEYLESQLSYWRGRLGGAPRLEIPGDRARPASRTDRGGTYRFELGAEAAAGLKAAGRAEGATLFITLLATFNVLLSRHSGQDDILVGTPVVNRTRIELEPLIGFFANMLVIRTSLAGGPSFRELLGRVKEAVLGAYAHQEVPFEKLVEELHVERDPSRMPLFQIAFSLENAAQQRLELSGLLMSPLEVDTRTAKFDLFLNLYDEGERLRGRWVYNSDLFDESTIAYLHGHFEKLLGEVVARPDAPVGDLEMLLDEERVLLGAAEDFDQQPPDAGNFLNISFD